MPILNNVKHEAFAQARATGLSVDEAYQKAGYSKNRGNAARLNAREDVKARLTELQQEIADKSIWGAVERIDMLKRIAEAAEKKSPRVAVSAINEANRMQGSHSPAKFDHTSSDGSISPPRVIEFVAPTVKAVGTEKE